MTTENSIQLSVGDNVAVAIRDLAAGDSVNGNGLAATAPVPRGHKVATKGISTGDNVIKYGQIIGVATTDIAPGDHVHTHNAGMSDFERDYAFGQDAHAVSMVPAAERRTFLGFKRQNGQVGTRNYIGLLATVNCSATVVRKAATEMADSGILDQFPNVDGIVPVFHGTGCCMSSQGEGFAMLQRTLWGYARHPNFAAIVLVGLGCEVNQISFLLEAYGITPGESFQTLVIQDVGGTRKTIDAITETVKGVLPKANEATRTPQPASEITVALQCGGSDGYSGITANPALGNAVDRLVAQGGTGVLSETPEIYGAEHLLTRRAQSQEIGEKLIERIRWWEDYTRIHGAEMNNNPTPGNKAGGLTTILEKSLGAAAKGGTTNLVDVYKYAEPISAKGFVFMDSPGYDPASITGQVASGANVVCFTTGRGSVYGNKPVPSIKLATSTRLYEHMIDDMDINAGSIVDGGKTVQDVGEETFEMILRVAGGERTKSEIEGLGDCEFVPWQIGAVM